MGTDPYSAVILPLRIAETGVTTSTTEVTITARVPPLSLLLHPANARISNSISDPESEKPTFIFSQIKFDT
jgi:hypothetical protein